MSLAERIVEWTERAAIMLGVLIVGLALLEVTTSRTSERVNRRPWFDLRSERSAAARHIRQHGISSAWETHFADAERRFAGPPTLRAAELQAAGWTQRSSHTWWIEFDSQTLILFVVTFPDQPGELAQLTRVSDSAGLIMPMPVVLSRDLFLDEPVRFNGEPARHRAVLNADPPVPPAP